MVCQSISIWVFTHEIKSFAVLNEIFFLGLGSPIAFITAQQLLIAAPRIEERGLKETARRALLNCSQVFRYAIATGRAERDPVPDLKGALQPVKTTHFLTMTEPKAIVSFYVPFTDITQLCNEMRFTACPFGVCRPGELRAAERSEKP